jgi:hypothetical protein
MVQICNGVPGSVTSVISHGFQSQLTVSRVAATLQVEREPTGDLVKGR